LLKTSANVKNKKGTIELGDLRYLGSGLIDPEDEGCGEGDGRQEGVGASVVAGVRAATWRGVTRVSAEALEDYLVEHIRRLTNLPIGEARSLSSIVLRIDLGAEATEIVLCAVTLFRGQNPHFAIVDMRPRLEGGEDLAWDDREETRVRIRLPVRFQTRGGRTWLDGRRHIGEGKHLNVRLRESLRSAHSELLGVNVSPVTPQDQLAAAQGPQTASARRISCLAFLAPDLQARILHGQEPKAVTLRAILKSEVPLAWADQRALFASFA
jgi:hypothetical protein